MRTILGGFSLLLNVSVNCPFCGIYEDELHCFVKCIRLQAIWNYIIAFLSRSIQWLQTITDADLLLGYIHGHCTDANIHIWKIFHAEAIRAIWYSRCRKLYDNEDMHIEAIKGSIRYRVQTTFSIYEASN